MNNNRAQSKSDENFEDYVMELSNGCADLAKNLYGEYDDPVIKKIWYEYNKK